MDYYQSENIWGNEVESVMEHVKNHHENRSQNTLMVLMNSFIHFS